MNDFAERVAKNLRILYDSHEQLSREVEASKARRTFPTRSSLSQPQSPQFARIAAVNKDDCAASVAPVVLSYDVSNDFFVMHNHPLLTAFDARIPENSAHPLPGDCALVVDHGPVPVVDLSAQSAGAGNSVSLSASDFERCFSVLTLGAPCIPAKITEYKGPYASRDVDASSDAFTQNNSVHGPQVYRAKLYVHGLESQDFHEDFVIQLDHSAQDKIPDGTFVMIWRGPITHGKYLNFADPPFNTQYLSSSNFASGLYMQVPVWLPLRQL